MRIEITLPANRNLTGWLRVLDATGALLFGCPCLGKADSARAKAEGNPGRDPLRKFGDTPLGFWKGKLSPKPMKDTRTYGIHRVMMLDPLSGDAKRAYDNGRRGIWAHGGILNRLGRLRPTHGCIRVADAHMAAILDILDRYFAPLPVSERWVIVETKAA